MANFTTKEFNTEKELKDFIELNKELFHFVGYATSKRNNGKYAITY